MPAGERQLQGRRLGFSEPAPNALAIREGAIFLPLRRLIWMGTEMVRRPSLAGMIWAPPTNGASRRRFMTSHMAGRILPAR